MPITVKTLRDYLQDNTYHKSYFGTIQQLLAHDAN